MPEILAQKGFPFFISLVPRSIKNYEKPELRYRFVWVANSLRGISRALLFFIVKHNVLYINTSFAAFLLFGTVFAFI